MVTRHLYQSEDVAATLLYALCEGEPTLAVRAARELEISGLGDVLHAVLVLAWLLDDPSHPAQAARAAAFCARNTEGLLFALLTTTKREIPPCDTSEPPPAPPARGPTTPPPWTPPPSMTPTAAHCLSKAVTYSLGKAYWQHAYYLTRQLLDHTQSLCEFLAYHGVAESFRTLLENNVYTPLAERIVAHAFAARVAPPTPPPRVELRHTNIWKDRRALGGTAGRTFSIPSTALAQWRLTPAPHTRLLGAPLCVASSNAAPYWIELCKKYSVRQNGTNLVFPDADTEAAFYAAAFPDDIPDEWTVMERTKSHGIITPPPADNPWVPAFHLCWS